MLIGDDDDEVSNACIYMPYIQPHSTMMPKLFMCAYHTIMNLPIQVTNIQSLSYSRKNSTGKDGLSRRETISDHRYSCRKSKCMNGGKAKVCASFLIILWPKTVGL